LRLQPGGASRSLKNLFQEAGVPAWRRTVPLIYLGDKLLFVPGLGIDRGLAPWPGASPVAVPVAVGEGGFAASFAVLLWRDDQIIA
jgi:tRNA(Ile)-lysidine synthetase-like protein